MKGNATMKKTGGIAAVSLALGIAGGIALIHLLRLDYLVDVYDEDGNLQGHEMFILVRMYRCSGLADTAIPVKRYRHSFA